MDVWKANLVLNVDGNDTWSTRFMFRKCDGNYSKFGNMYYELNGGIKTSFGVPSEMEIRRSYSAYVVSQGFERELSSEELINLEYEMRDYLVTRIMYDKDVYLDEFYKKIVSLGATNFTL